VTRRERSILGNWRCGVTLQPGDTAVSFRICEQVFGGKTPIEPGSG
jgi:hypothetical protein